VLTELRTNVDESGVEGGEKSLTLSRELRKLGVVWKIAPSSNGKTADSGQSSASRLLRAIPPLLPSVDKIAC
jgi:hypothetical protein